MAAKHPAFPSVGEPRWGVMIVLAFIFIMLLLMLVGAV